MDKITDTQTGLIYPINSIKIKTKPRKIKTKKLLRELKNHLKKKYEKSTLLHMD